MAEAHCPASCGELIQGWFLGKESLVSCPIDWYSQVTIREKRFGNINSIPPLMRAAIYAALEFCQIEIHYAKSLWIDHHSSIPIGKGLASSTADICASATALARHFKLDIQPHHLAKLAAKLEPTDSTPFEQTTLFDHVNGDVIKQFTWVPNCQILILESPLVLLTRDVHSLKRDAATKANNTPEHTQTYRKIWQMFEQGINHHDIELIGKATTQSALLHQTRLPKPALSTLIELTDKYHLSGLNIAHSGTVVGLLYQENNVDIAPLINELTNRDFQYIYPKLYQCNVIAGGIR